MSHANQMSYGQVLDVAAWQQARRREFLPMKLFVVTGSLAVALLMGTLCAGWFTMLLLGAGREAILTELTGATYYAYWQARHGADMAAQAGTIWQGGLLGYGVWLLPWSAIAILSFWPALRRNETLVAERDPLPLPDPSIRVSPALQTHYDRDRPYLPPTEQGTLITVSKPSKPDRLHDLNVLRMMRVANDRTVREFGPLPAGGLPTVPKQKAPHLHKHEILWVNDQGNHSSEGDDMKLNQAVALTVMAAGVLSACGSGNHLVLADGAREAAINEELSRRSRIPVSELKRLLNECDSTQKSMNICAFRDFVAVDLDLDDELNAMRKSATPECRVEIDRAQDAWKEARDKACDEGAAAEEGGSMRPGLISFCKTAATKERLLQVKKMKTCAEAEQELRPQNSHSTQRLKE